MPLSSFQLSHCNNLSLILQMAKGIYTSLSNHISNIDQMILEKCTFTDVAHGIWGNIKMKNTSINTISIILTKKPSLVVCIKVVMKDIELYFQVEAKNDATTVNLGGQLHDDKADMVISLTLKSINQMIINGCNININNNNNN